MSKCSGYCGVACIDGSCPNALRENNPEYFRDCYGSMKKIQCRYCIYNKGCEDCCIAFYQNISEEQCRIEHGIKE